MKRALRRRFGPYLEILNAAWQNRDRPRYAWRILNDGVCDGCALGTTGMRDWTMDSVHLCWIRLNLLRLNTIPALDPARLSRVDTLERLSEAELRALGRLPIPMIRRSGDPGFSPLGWEEALEFAAERMRATDPDRLAFYLVSRGTANETYYAAQKAVRAMGSNHIDNSSRICHSPSTTGLKKAIGFAATTCSYTDSMDSDLVVFFGSDVANNQPVMMKYLHLAKKQGTKIAVVNPYREPGLERFWVPSSVDSAIFGTKVVDEFFPIRVGGDIPFILGVLKILLDTGRVDTAFIEARTEGWESLAKTLREADLESLQRESGASMDDLHRFADLYGRSKTAILVWSMGITMHRHGVDNVLAIANLALARGMIGRPGTGLMPIRGHSGVQGGAEMGCVPDLLPGGADLNPTSARAMSEQWGFSIPEWKGTFASDMLELADRNGIDVLYCAGGNLKRVLPDPEKARRSMEKIPLRIHHDIVFNPQMLVPGETVLLLPATTRYEMVGGNTETSTERRVIFNPEIPGPRIPEARDEWRVLVDLARRVRPDRAESLSFDSTADIREEIGRLIPRYDGIQNLTRKGDQFQWGGAMLGDEDFPLPGGRARFHTVSVPANDARPGWFHLNTRRGKQFNTMIFGKSDLLVGAERDAVVLAESDMKTLGIKNGEAITVRSKKTAMPARAIPGALVPGTAMMFWPEASALISEGAKDSESGMPAYRDTLVEIIPQRPNS